MSQTNPILVVVGILFNERDQVLVGQRTVKDRYFAKWEFPGGKIEANETEVQALKREFKEEVGIDLGSGHPFMEIEHNYPDRQVKLFVRTIKEYEGTVCPMEGQQLKWVNIEELRELDFLQGNLPMIEKLERSFNSA